MTKRPEIIDLAMKAKSISKVTPVAPGLLLDAACVSKNPDLFFAEDLKGIQVAKKICAGCPVIAQCQNWAREYEEFGVFGGETEDERAALRKGKPFADPKAANNPEDDLRVLLNASLQEASARFGVNERTILRWRNVLKSASEAA